jgi:hypothetical protein
MQKLTADDLKTLRKILAAPIEDERLEIVNEILNQNMEMLQALVRLGLPKELEPTSYLMLLLGRAKE